MELLKKIEEQREEILTVYQDLHNLPEKGWEEVKTAQYLKEALEKAGFQVITNVGNTTGVIGILKGKEPGPVFALRADMDALAFKINGEDVNIHACGHDANSTMVLMAALEIAKVGIKRGTLKIVFQPAEEVLGGAEAMLASGLLDDVEEMIGIHLRPIQEAKLGQATPALCHGSSYVVTAKLKGLASHGARPHLGINTVDAGAAVVNAVNAIKLNPSVPFSVKTTKFVAGGTAHNIIPDSADMVFDLRAQTNDAMEELIEKTRNAIENAAATVGAKAEVTIKGGVPGAEYDGEMVARAKQAIEAVLGKALDPIVTPGGEDFHYYSTKGKIKTAYIGLGADLEPGLHHPEMKFNLDALVNGTKIITYCIYQRLIA
ncbi:MAG: amidohydrolase [Clostridia bacterium]|nr:amidohydrolase [Clostridia bacterium]